MRQSLIDSYSKKELEQIIQQSNSFRDLAFKLGYKSYSGKLKNFLQEKTINFDTSHFKRKEITIRTEEQIFCENSIVDQKTLRRHFFQLSQSYYYCSICGQKPFWNGKDLTLILDHINGQNKDNRLENLRWVCPNCNQQLDTTNGKNKHTLIKKYYCPECGKEVSKEGCRCQECYAKSKIIKIQDMPITKEQLKQLIRTKPFTQIGKDFNVSDNAIRKWCDKFNLPRKKTQINKYTDQEWAKI